jgi:hypothetical protein
VRKEGRRSSLSSTLFCSSDGMDPGKEGGRTDMFAVGGVFEVRGAQPRWTCSWEAFICKSVMLARTETMRCCSKCFDLSRKKQSHTKARVTYFIPVEIAVALGPAWRSAKTSEHQSVANFNI